VTYLAATAITMILGLILGAAPVTRALTFGKLGQKDSASWKYMWIAQLAFHFGADLIVASFTINAKDYDESRMPAFWDLALFYTSRPRMAWIPLAAFGSWSAWNSVAKATMISEVFMQIAGCYYLGLTANFATNNGFYQHLHYNSSAQMMYFGALFTLILTLGSIIALICSVSVISRSGKGTVRSCVGICCSWGFVIVFGITAFVGRWIFLIGYVRLAGDLYCPPKLLDQALVWITMNVAGIVLGTGL
jgi:hypothetical protein